MAGQRAKLFGSRLEFAGIRARDATSWEFMQYSYFTQDVDLFRFADQGVEELQQFMYVSNFIRIAALLRIQDRSVYYILE